MDPITFEEKDVEGFQYGPPYAIPVMNGDVTLRQNKDGGAKTADRKQKKREKTVCCFCFKTTKLRRRQYIVSFFTNVGIFSLLLGYTFLGSFIFLAIEGGNNNQILKPRMLPDKQFTDSRKNQADDQFNDSRTKQDTQDDKNSNEFKQQTTFSFLDTAISDKYSQSNNYSYLSDASSEARAKTVENIWEITVSLNILYRENWTRLAGLEISKFQDELVHRVAQEMAAQYGAAYQEMALGGSMHSAGGDLSFHEDGGDWSLAKAFFYSLTVLTTIGYGSIAPRTSLGKAATIGYALFGIPLTMLYLTSVGSLLSRVARGAFSRALCCCLCSNCGYCCYDERRMAEKERRMKMKRQQEEMQNLQSSSNNSTSNPALKTQEPFYVVRSTEEQNKESNSKSTPNLSRDLDNISWPDTDSKLSMQGLSILAPILLCLCIMFAYIVIGTIVLYNIDNLRPIDGFYFCFMSLSTIGFGNLVPGIHNRDPNKEYSEATTLWFCSIYILSGLALTAMCFNVVHDEIIHRLKHRQKQWSQKGNTVKDESNIRDPFYIAS